MPQEKTTHSAERLITDLQFQQILHLAEDIQYGSITLVFQDHVLVQIDKNEKIRIPKT